MSVAKKSNPALWERSKQRAKAKMGGKHSARAMQLATQMYKKAGGGYRGKKSSSNKLSKWSKQKWTTASGKPSEGKRVYAPKSRMDALKRSAVGRKKLAAAERKKRAAHAQGKQVARHGLHKGQKYT